MQSRQSQVPIVALLSAMVLACADTPPVGPVPNGPEPQFDFTNGPGELPNVIRFEEEGGVGVIYDSETDLLLLVGLPENPADAFDCGGTEPFDQNTVQVVGILREVFKVLLKSDVHLHVYQGATFDGFCSSVPLAQGTGRLILNDNDAAVSGTRANSFGASVNGSVMLESGGTAQVSAHVRFLIHQDGTFEEIISQVHMN